MSHTSMHINCDMGESFGRYTLADDEGLMPYINSCNIACGYHAGDPLIISNTIQAGIKHNLELGAHPSYPDRAGFGRRYMEITQEELVPILIYQISALKGMIEAYGGSLNHVKPHGALYNTAAKNKIVATSVIKAISTISKDLILYTLPNSVLHKMADQNGIKVYTEAFIDRTYNDDLSLTSRQLPNAVITDPKQAASHANLIWNQHQVETIENSIQSISPKTMCIHGDNPNALDILKHLRG